MVVWATPKSCLLALGMRLLAAYVVQAAVASPHVSVSSSKPRVFVYDLPVSLPSGVPTRDDQKCDELVSGSPDLLACLFGEEFTVPTTLGPLKLRKTDQYAMGRIFLWRIMGSANRVDHPSEADLFFVPFWFSDGFPTNCPTATEIFGQLIHLDASTLGKHIFLSPRVAHSGDVCPFWWGHPWHRGLPQGQVDYNAPDNEKLAAGYMNAVMKFALEDRNCCWWVVGENTHSIPYPGFGSGLGPDMTQILWMLREPSRSRPVLVMGAFGIHGDPAERSKWLRQMLAKECDVYGPPICQGIVLTVVQEPGHALSLSDNTLMQLVMAMLQSRFCYQPMGDTPSRKGIVDSILLGCIPVLFSMNQTRLWPWHIPDLSNIAVVLDVTQGSPIDQLKKIDEARVTQLRQGVAEAARHLAYTLQDGTGDAVETALFHAWKQTGGRPEERQMLRGAPVPWSSTQPAHKVEHHNVPGYEVAKEKTPERWLWWSCSRIGIGYVVLLCSIVIGVGIGLMVLQTCPKSEPAKRFVVGDVRPTGSAERDQKSWR